MKVYLIKGQPKDSVATRTVDDTINEEFALAMVKDKEERYTAWRFWVEVSERGGVEEL